MAVLGDYVQMEYPYGERRAAVRRSGWVVLRSKGGHRPATMEEALN
jgi:hypothetical protein